MWVWVVVGLAAFFALVIASLCVPVHALLDYDTAAEPGFRVSIVWLFGLVRREITVPARKRARPKRSRSLPLNAILRIAQTKGLFGRLKRLATDIVATVKIKEMVVSLRVGLSDPAEAGMVIGIVSAARAVMRLPPQYRIELQPAFSTDIAIEGQAYCALQIRPIRLIVPFGRFVLSPPGRQLMKTAIFKR